MKLKHFLLTALILFCGMGGAYATKRYVGFTTGSNHLDLQDALATATTGDTVFVAAGLYLADATQFTVKQNVTLIGGYAKGDNVDNLTRRYPGQFIPFDSSNLSSTTQFTILDGNSYKSTLPAQKHRVIKVENGGVVDGCLIRNGHVRNDHGGGVLLDGGKLYNSIVRGNVAMSKPDTTLESLGGGVFIKNGGELINCLVAYNMANDGYGVAAGEGGGRMINNTITANTYAPVFSKIPGTNGTLFEMYKHNAALDYRPGSITKMANKIYLTDFYISRTLTTEGQYAVFCAAMDIPVSVSGRLDVTPLLGLREPTLNAETVGKRYFGTGTQPTGEAPIVQSQTNENQSGLKYAGGIWHPHLDTASVEYPIGISWWGSLAYSVWLGGGLPTEGQWEFAARRIPGGVGTGMVNENMYSEAYGTTNITAKNTWVILDTIAWVDNSVSIDTAPSHGLGIGGTSRVHEVARKRPNAMGIYDMTGLMLEWMADFYVGNLDTELYPNASTNPIQTAGPLSERTLRNGSWRQTSRAEFFLGNRTFFSPVQFGTYSAYSFRPIVAF